MIIYTSIYSINSYLFIFIRSYYLYTEHFFTPSYSLIKFEHTIMRITCRTILLLLLISILIMAYCSTPVDAGILKHIKKPHRVHSRRPQAVRYKIKTKTKYKTKTKITHKRKRPGILKKIRG